MKTINVAFIFVMMISISKMNLVLGVEKEKDESLIGESKRKGSGLHKLSEANYIIVYFRSYSGTLTYNKGFINGGVRNGDCSSRGSIDHLEYNNTVVETNDQLKITPS